MNNEQVRAVAKAWAGRLLADAQTPQEMIDRAYATALGRAPSPQETEAVLKFLGHTSGTYEVSGVGEMPWTPFCQMIFGLNEFLYGE